MASLCEFWSMPIGKVAYGNHEFSVTREGMYVITLNSKTLYFQNFDDAKAWVRYIENKSTGEDNE